jgi:hypothetical protein
MTASPVKAVEYTHKVSRGVGIGLKTPLWQLELALSKRKLNRRERRALERETQPRKKSA